ncbi:MAG: hypothetical protein GX556_16185 [Fibrobacter sp.]|nr:hypothetical protein [Fibrobacter sp.]
MLTEHDKIERLCPMLGHEISFSYCRKPGQEIPCRKVFDCWWERFDIQAFISENFSTEVQNTLREPPKQKIHSLLEIIEQARRNTSEKQGSC